VQPIRSFPRKREFNAEAWWAANGELQIKDARCNQKRKLLVALLGLQLLLLLNNGLMPFNDFGHPHPNQRNINHQGPGSRIGHLTGSNEETPRVSAVVLRIHRPSPSKDFPVTHK